MLPVTGCPQEWAPIEFIERRYAQVEAFDDSIPICQSASNSRPIWSAGAFV